MISDEALARLAVAWEACQLSEAARLIVSAEDPIAQADEVLEAAQRFTQAIAELAQQHGTKWQPEPRTNDDGWWRTNLHHHPEEAAQDLDDWAIRHQDGEDLDSAPVSRHLH
ncbi:hypothetical protein GCM10009789_08110 [Kribbella sancticallisti]|uniref:Uncharacterized protein n=1 Tax=Kribbella sancticallisti TaxID=460087 RepID=A0ABP4N7K9_9ACTN